MGPMRNGSNVGVKEAWQVANGASVCTSGSEPIVELLRLCVMEGCIAGMLMPSHERFQDVEWHVQACLLWPEFRTEDLLSGV